MPVMAVPLALAGEVKVWGLDDVGQATVPASLKGVAVSQVALGDTVALALTAAGKVVAWGTNSPARLEKIPAEVANADVVQIAVGSTSTSYAGAVTRDGRVLTWGPKSKFATPLDVPVGLTGVTQLATNERNAVALKADGSVVAWGADDSTSHGLNEVPAQLRAPGSAQAVTMDGFTAFALTTQGTVVAWGTESRRETTQKLPEQVEVPGNVRAVTSAAGWGFALLADNTLLPWGGSHLYQALPASMLTATSVSMTGSGAGLGLVDTSGVIRYGCAVCSHSPDLPVEEPVPAELIGAAVAQFVVGPPQHRESGYSTNGAVVVTKMLPAVAPSIAGGATVGGTLTGTPGTFSASPTSVTGQWLADGAAIPGATGATLSLTAGMVGKKITYQSTASKPGESTVSSTSTAVTVAPASDNNPLAPAKVRSKTKVSKVTAAKKGAKVTVTGKVTASKSPAGKAKVMIKKGKKTILAKTTKVTTKGAVKLTVKKFAQLVAKKTKAKGKKARTAYRGKYIVTITYTGNTQVNPSTAAKKFTIKK
ncbi:hypothetical protein [Nocardioides soli]|uniref:Uncharacterized protein n=1 Tax=Nocardioides soli TaxID=1036020 RepID=A0A7W4VS61_9ACTN|nr:hypothetical protein [Nocardioides soli]MBB3040379.1 hypothetical protein [Nocardioides soli]